MEKIAIGGCFIEIGPGSVLKNLAKRMHSDKIAISLDSPKTIEEGIKILEGKSV